MKTTAKLKFILTLLALIHFTSFYGQFTDTIKLDSIRFTVDSIKIDSLNYCFSAQEVRNIAAATFKYNESIRYSQELKKQRTACLMELRQIETEKAQLKLQNEFLKVDLYYQQKQIQLIKIGCISFGIIGVGTVAYLLISK